MLEDMQTYVKDLTKRRNVLQNMIDDKKAAFKIRYSQCACTCAS